jgi:hypothetical protein
VRCRIQAAFRRLEPKAQLALAGGVVLLVVVIAVVAVTLGGGRSSERTASPTEAGAVRTDTPSAGPAQAPGAVTSDPVPMQTAAAQTLTAENNEELAALLATTDPGGEAVAQFAAKYHGRTIEFDGNLASMSRHGDDKTTFSSMPEITARRARSGRTSSSEMSTSPMICTSPGPTFPTCWAPGTIFTSSLASGTSPIRCSFSSRSPRT